MSRARDPRGGTRPAPEPAAYLPPSGEPPEGPCFVLVRRNDETSFKRKNPWAIRRSLESVGGSGLKAKALRSGALLVETQGHRQTAALLQLTLFQGHQVTVTLADRLNGVMGVVSSDILVEMSNEELLEELQHQGVIMVQRLPSRDIARLGPNPTLKLRFKANSLPTSILCGYEVVAVNPWVAPLPQCRNCWDVGSHSARNCRRRIAVCGRCSQEHATDSCTADTPCCHNWGAHTHPDFWSYTRSISILSCTYHIGHTRRTTAVSCAPVPSALLNLFIAR